MIASLFLRQLLNGLDREQLVFLASYELEREELIKMLLEATDEHLDMFLNISGYAPPLRTDEVLLLLQEALINASWHEMRNIIQNTATKERLIDTICSVSIDRYSSFIDIIKSFN